MAESGPVDLLLRVGKAYAMTGEDVVYRSVAIRDDRIVAVSADEHGLDELRGSQTVVVDDSELVLFPAFNDTHNHQLYSAYDLDYVSLEDAESISEVVEILRGRAAETPPGAWILTARNWNESHLAERRFPTAIELDAATPDHPILVQRGGHNGVLNSLALQRAGLGPDSPDPVGGSMARDADGVPTGLLTSRALEPIRAMIEPQTRKLQMDLLSRQCASYNARGIGSVRDPGLFVDDMATYQQLWAQKRLTTRSRVLFWVLPDASIEEKLAFIDSWAVSSGFGDNMLKIWGFKFVMDGGVEGAHLCAPYANNPNFHGHSFWEAEDFERLVDRAVSRRWKVGCHACGDCAVRRVLDAYERVLERHPDTPPGSLVIEHAFLANESERARAIRLGVAITIQHPLLYALGGNLVEHWGEERAREVMPVREWLDEGATVAAGSDCNVSFFDPLLSIWGLVTRGTKTAGVQGLEHAVTRYEAIRLYTSDGGKLLGEEAELGAIEAGQFADLVAFRTDLLECPLDDIPQLSPEWTLVGGKAVYDPEGQLPASDFRRDSVSLPL